MDVQKAMGTIRLLEESALSQGKIQTISASVKILTTFAFLIIVISFPVNRLSGLMIYFLYPFVIMAVAQIPFSLVWKRLIIVLPFPVIAGISNLFLEREIITNVGNLFVTEGMISFLNIVCKAILCVMAVLVLIGTTSMEKITHALTKFHIPVLFILILEMIYRYLSVLMEEAMTMRNAYLLRNPGKKALTFSDMGKFLGKLVIRSFERQERIYEAMKCRGYLLNPSFIIKDEAKKHEWLYFIGWTGSFVICRFINVSQQLGQFIIF